MRDASEEVEGLSALGISGDKPERQKQFDDEHSLGYTLLSDPDHQAAEAYGVWRKKKLYGKTYLGIARSIFIVGPDGRIEHAIYKISPKDTSEKLAAALSG